MDFTALSLSDLLAYDFSAADAETLAAYQAELHARFTAIREGTPTVAQVEEARSLHARHAETRTFASEQAEADETALSELDSLTFADEDAEEEDVEVTDEADEDAEEEPEPEAEVVDEADEPEAEVAAAAAPAKKVAAAVQTKARTTATASLAGKRPAVPAKRGADLVSITAAVDTQFAAGSSISLSDLGEAAKYRLEGMDTPNGDGVTEDLRKFPVGKVAIPYPTDLQIDATMSTEAIEAVLIRAADETKIQDQVSGQKYDSLVAANGWCAPSETLYDLCAGEVVDGILSIGEVQVNRGGFKHTTGIDFSTIYSGVGFLQTEAQAIAGTTKTCYEVPCPTFTDERLDAIGLCIKVPILLEVGYPEAVKRVMSASMIAHQYKVNASVIARILTIAGAALDPTPDFASAFGELLNTLDIEANILRQKYRLGKKASMEVVLPVWALDVARNELGLRTGRPKDAVTDAEIMAHFAARNYNVQFVYGWQEWAGTELTWPSTVEALIYPAGTLVKGVSNVINLSAVYDAASLATNIYTGLFFEQGLLVAKMCYEVRRVTVPVTGAFTGKTGAASL